MPIQSAPWALAALRTLAMTSVRMLVSRSVPVTALEMVARVRPLMRFLPTLAMKPSLALSLLRGVPVYGDERAQVGFRNVIMKDLARVSIGTEA